MNFLKKIIGCKVKSDVPLYVYNTSFTVLNPHGKLIDFIQFDRRFANKDKMRIRRNLQKLHRDCKVIQKGYYRIYNKR